ncbi:MAG: DUF1353 domain-containing protein [Pseudomonadota bacterium]
MSAFTDFDDYERVAGTRKTYVIGSDLVWEIGKKGSGHFVTVKAGTTFDISAPRWLEWAQSPHDPQVLKAAAVHDQHSREGYDIPFASAEFRRACEALGSSRAKAWRLFWATFIYQQAARILRR